MNTLTKSKQQLSVAVQIKVPGRRKFCFCLLVSTLSDEFIYPGYYIPSLILQSASSGFSCGLETRSTPGILQNFSANFATLTCVALQTKQVVKS